MTQCPNCQTNNEDSVLYCRQCGARLFELPTTDRLAMGVDTVNWTGTQRADPQIVPTNLEVDFKVRLKIGDAREVEMPLHKAVHLGRLDPAQGIFPEIDLTSEAAGMGISRRHARIFKRQGMAVVEDLGSANGTFLNGKRLVPYLFEPLQDGDLLQLGRLLVKVFVAQA